MADDNLMDFFTDYDKRRPKSVISNQCKEQQTKLDNFSDKSQHIFQPLHNKHPNVVPDDSLHNKHPNVVPDDLHGLLKKSVKLGNQNVFSQLLHSCEHSFLHSNSRHGSSYNNTHLNDLLRLAVEHGRTEMVQQLILKGADVNIRVNRSSLLEIACKTCDLNLIKCLVNYKADVKAVNHRGESLIFTVIMSDGTTKQIEDVLKYLVDEGVNPNTISSTGKHPLHIAATCSVIAIKEFIQRGCDVNVKDNILGDTPLHVACNRCNEETIMALLKHGAIMNSLNNPGQTPLEKLLQSASGTDFHSKTRRELAKRLMALGFCINEQSQSSRCRRNKAVDVYKRLQMSQCDIPTLKCLSRAEVRRHIGGVYFNRTLDQLEIPASLKAYLSFQ